MGLMREPPPLGCRVDSGRDGYHTCYALSGLAISQQAAEVRSGTTTLLGLSSKLPDAGTGTLVRLRPWLGAHDAAVVTDPLVVARPTTGADGSCPERGTRAARRNARLLSLQAVDGTLSVPRMTCGRTHDRARNPTRRITRQGA